MNSEKKDKYIQTREKMIIMEPRPSNTRGGGVPEVDYPTAKAEELHRTKEEPSVRTEKAQDMINIRHRLNQLGY